MTDLYYNKLGIGSRARFLENRPYRIDKNGHGKWSVSRFKRGTSSRNPAGYVAFATDFATFEEACDFLLDHINSNTAVQSFYIDVEAVPAPPGGCQ